MFNLIKRDIITLWRDKGSLFFVIVFPSLLVFLLGSLLQHMDNADNVIDPIVMHYQVQAQEPIAIAAIDAFVLALEENDIISLVPTSDSAAAQEMVDNGNASAVITFTQPFGVSIYQGQDSIQNRAIESIFRGFARQVAGYQTLMQYAPAKISAAADAAAQQLINQKDLGYNRSMMDYYAVTMIVMIMFMGGAIGGASTLYESRRDGTLRRTMASPKNRANLYIQSVLSAVPQHVLQVACVMIPSVLFFGAHYANTWQDNILLFSTLFVAGLCVNAVAMLIGMFLSVNPTVVFMPLLWVMMFISGTFSKEVVVPAASAYSPIYLIQNAAFDLTVFGRSEKCLQVLLVSIGILALFTAIGALLFRRKGIILK